MNICCCECGCSDEVDTGYCDYCSEFNDLQEHPRPKTSSAVKHDDGKPILALLPGEALTEIAKVLTYGASKYEAHNWRGGFVWSRVTSALLRHVFAWLRGEDKDPETGLSHLAHAGCNILFLLTFEVTKTGTDDRYKTEVSV